MTAIRISSHGDTKNNTEADQLGAQHPADHQGHEDGFGSQAAARARRGGVGGALRREDERTFKKRRAAGVERSASAAPGASGKEQPKGFIDLQPRTVKQVL